MSFWIYLSYWICHFVYQNFSDLQLFPLSKSIFVISMNNQHHRVIPNSIHGFLNQRGSEIQSTLDHQRKRLNNIDQFIINARSAQGTLRDYIDTLVTIQRNQTDLAQSFKLPKTPRIVFNLPLVITEKRRLLPWMPMEGFIPNIVTVALFTCGDFNCYVCLKCASNATSILLSRPWSRDSLWSIQSSQHPAPFTCSCGKQILF